MMENAHKLLSREFRTSFSTTPLLYDTNTHSLTFREQLSRYINKSFQA